MMVTACGAGGRASVTDATPDAFVTAMTLGPLSVPLDKVPALTLKKMLAPLAGFAPSESPGARLTESGTGKAVECVPV